ncbi:MAG TPA: lipid II flippase MurJ [candidate division Zixibacteria bacterium]|nr:lipid II flippase MurJ [candidate division Zixibacteria bacterium]
MRITITARRLAYRLVPAGAAVVSVLYLGNYVMGQVRDIIFAASFGAGMELDAYNAAFSLPELLLDVLVEAGLAAPFIPIFLRLRAVADGGEADRFARAILTGAVAIMGVASLVLFVVAEATTSLIAPGFTGEQRELYVNLFRVMLASQVLFAASLTLGQVMLAEQRYFWYAAAPILYNTGIILGSLALSGSIGIYGPAVGALLGALLHLSTRFIGLRNSSFRIGFGWRANPGPIREFVRLMLPKMVSHPVDTATFVFFTNVASGLAAGGVTVISLARNYMSVPVTVIGIAFALAVFPALSTAHATGDRRGFLRLLGSNTASILLITTFAALVAVVLGEFGIRILLGRGAFDEEDVLRTAGALSVFALAIPFESLTHLLSRAIYATRHTLLQVLASLLALVVTVVATLALLPSAGLTAIPLGFTIGQVVKVGLLSLALAVRLRRFEGAPLEGEAAA